MNSNSINVIKILKTFNKNYQKWYPSDNMRKRKQKYEFYKSGFPWLYTFIYMFLYCIDNFFNNYSKILGVFLDETPVKIWTNTDTKAIKKHIKKLKNVHIKKPPASYEISYLVFCHYLQPLNLSINVFC